MLKLPGVLFHVAIAQLLLFYTARPKNAEQGAALLTDLVPGGSLFFFQGVSAAAPGPRTGAPRKDDGYDSEFSDLDESPRLLTTDPYSVAQPGGTTAAGVGPREEEDVDLHFSPAREDPYQQVDQECHPDLQPAAAAAKKEGAAGPGAGTTTLAAAPASATCSEVRRRDKGPRRVDVEEGEDLLPPELCADELESFCEDSEDEDFDFAALGERFPEDGEIYVSEDEDQDFPYDDDWDVDFEGQYKEKRSRSRPGYDSRTPTPPPRQEKQDPEVVHVEQRGPSPLQERVAVAARAGQQEYGRGSSSAPRGRRSGAVSSSRSRSRSRRPGPRLQLHANYTQSSSSRPGVLQLHAREEPGRRSSPPRSRSRSSTCRKKRNKHKAEAGDGDRAEARKQMEGTRSPPRTNGSRGRNRSRTSRGRNHRKCGRTSEDEYVFPEIKFKPKNYTPSLRQQAEDAFYQDWKKAQKQNPHAYPFFNALVNFFPKVSDPSAPMNQLEFFLDDHVENNPVGGRTSNGRRGNGRGRGAAAATSTATIQSLFRFFDFGLTIKHPWQTSQKLWSPAKPQELWGMVKKYVVKLNEKNPSLFIPVPNISVPGYLQQEADHLNKVKAEGRRHDDQKVDPYNPLQRLDNGVGGAVALVRLKAEEDPLAKAMTKWYQYEKHPYDHYEDETRRESDWGRTNEPKSWSWYKFDSEKEKVHLVNQATKVYGGQKTELLRLDSLWKLAALVIKKGNEEKNRLLQLKAEEMQESGLTQEAERSPRAGGYFSLTLFGLSAGEKALYQHLLRRSQEEESSAVVVVGSGRDEYLQKVNEQMEKEWRDKNREKYDEQGVMRKELRERSNSTGVEGGETSWTSTSWWKKHQPEKDHSFEFQAGKHVLERQVANEYRAVKIKKWYKMMVAIRPFEQLEEKATARQHVPLQQGLAAARVRKFLEKKVSGKRIFLPLAGSGSLYVKAVKQFRRSICPFALEMKKDDATRQWEKTDDGQNYVFAKTPTTLEEAQHQLNSSILLHNLVYANACQVAVTTFGKWGENNEKLYYDQKLNVYYTTLTASTGETGKTHQLRAHVVAFFAKHGYHAHLVGDELYAKVATDPKYRQSFLFPGPEEAALLQYQTSASGIKSNMGSLPPSLQELREQSNRIRKAMKNLGQFWKPKKSKKESSRKQNGWISSRFCVRLILGWNIKV
ncbi:unnamed protein product [Amoebophrya sp. A120]|nr:unnamed protein product [Amoebophrya sp. A120]|eukprot:GSA120T00013611001.1